MRTGITLVREHGEENFDVVTGPEVPLHQQLADFKKAVGESGGKTHPAFAQIEIWTSSEGRIKHIKFSKPEPAKPAEAPAPPPPLPLVVDEPIATDVAPAEVAETAPPAPGTNSTEEKPTDAPAPSSPPAAGAKKTQPRRRNR